MNDSLKLLEGVWLASDQDSRLELRIEIKNGVALVSACDRYDGEVFEVRNVLWDGKSLKFGLVVPSTGYTTASEITPLSRARFLQRVTFEETWTKQKPLKRSGAKKRKPSKG